MEVAVRQEFEAPLIDIEEQRRTRFLNRSCAFFGKPAVQVERLYPGDPEIATRVIRLVAAVLRGLRPSRRGARHRGEGWPGGARPLPTDTGAPVHRDRAGRDRHSNQSLESAGIRSAAASA